VKILVDFPPNIAEIEALVPDVRERKGVLFAYGDAVYNPSGVAIPTWLVKHEEVHLKQQAEFTPDPARWWEMYLADGGFRLQEELPAHQAEWKEFCRHEKRREARARYLTYISERLAGPLYGRLITVAGARAKIAGQGKVALARLLPQGGKG
jgi:hypothetical protein